MYQKQTTRSTVETKFLQRFPAKHQWYSSISHGTYHVQYSISRVINITIKKLNFYDRDNLRYVRIIIIFIKFP